MTNRKIFLSILFLIFWIQSRAQDNVDYIEFNDRYNIVHGVYLGWTAHYGEIDNENAYFFGLKAAYVANQQYEIGLIGVAFYSEQDDFGLDSNEIDLHGGYGGLHFEPILFKHSKFSLSFPLLVGGGAMGRKKEDFQNTTHNQDRGPNDWESFFISEPGMNILYNISRYVQLELGARYRFSSKVKLSNNSPNRISGFSFGLGMKVGVFNIGKNRYKKHI